MHGHQIAAQFIWSKLFRSSQWARNRYTMLIQCWAGVADAVPTLNQHRIDISCGLQHVLWIHGYTADGGGGGVRVPLHLPHVLIHGRREGSRSDLIKSYCPLVDSINPRRSHCLHTVCQGSDPLYTRDTNFQSTYFYPRGTYAYRPTWSLFCRIKVNSVSINKIFCKYNVVNDHICKYL